MKKLLILNTAWIIALLGLASCKSHKVVSSVPSPVLEYDLTEFDLYTYNMCELYDDNVVRTERFCACPDDFFDTAKEKQMKKVEELYLLIHPKTNEALYLTTKSHKYIYENQTGFLNDPLLYSNKMSVDNIEGIYIGKAVPSENKIIFEHRKKRSKDLTFHYDPGRIPNEIYITEVNVPTAENRYTNKQKILVSEALKFSLRFKKQTDFQFYYKENDSLIASHKLFIHMGKEKKLFFEIKGFETKFMKIKDPFEYYSSSTQSSMKSIR